MKFVALFYFLNRMIKSCDLWVRAGFLTASVKSCNLLKYLKILVVS